MNHEIKSLTGLRGVCAVLVMLYHFKFYNFFPAPLSNFFLHGYLAVDLFFILSGFVMCYSYASLFDKGFSWTRHKYFMLRRLSRIYPLYIFLTLLTITVFWFFPEKNDTGEPLNGFNIMLNITMLQSWGWGQSYLSPSWSISSEFLAYLIFPFLLPIVFSSSRLHRYLLGASCVASLFVLSIIPDTIIDFGQEGKPMNIWHENTFGPIVRCLAEFIIGMLCYRFYKTCHHSHLFYASSFVQPIIIGVLVVLLFFQKADIFIVLLFPFLLLSLTKENSLFAKIFTLPPFYQLGLISYALYLCHLMTYWIKPALFEFIDGMNFPAPHVTVLILQCLLSCSAATLLYQGLEKPSRHFFLGFISKPA